MSKVHISLVGGQVLPVYLGILEAKPDKVVLVHSEETKEQAYRIKGLVDGDLELISFDPVDFPKIWSQAKTCIQNLEAFDIISINVSGGTKPWTICFYDILKDYPKSEVIYIDQNNKIYDLKTNRNHFSDLIIETDLIFQLSGYPLKSFHTLAHYTQDDIKNVKIIRKLRQFSFWEFKYLIEDLASDISKTKSTTFKGSSLEWFLSEESFLISLQNAHRTQGATLRSKNIRNLLLNTGWFELEVALLFSEWVNTKDLRMNSIVSYTNNGNDKNEIDIIVNVGKKLLFVECKTQVFDIKDVDKFKNVVRNYGGLGCKSLLFTDAPLKENVLEKCRDNDILTFSMQSFKSEKDPIKVLFQMLEKELFQINPK